MKQQPVRLRQIIFLRERVEHWDEYPFNVPIIRNLKEINLRSKVCFFVGENGSGKSTLLEAIAEHCGYGRQGGSKHMWRRPEPGEEHPVDRLAKALRLSWSNKIATGYFLRAESFFNVATYIDEIGGDDVYGGKSLHEQSHGESFLALFENRFFRHGFYLLDEPEAALSPQRQLSFLVLLHNLLQGNNDIQFIIATHSPIILAFPQSQILSFNGSELTEIGYAQSEPYQIVSDFLKSPQRYLHKLLEEDDRQGKLL